MSARRLRHHGFGEKRGGARQARAIAQRGCLFTTFSTSYTRGTEDTSPAAGITSPNIAEIHPLMRNLALRYDRSVFFAKIETLFSGRHVAVDADLQEELMPGYEMSLNLAYRF